MRFERSKVSCRWIGVATEIVGCSFILDPLKLLYFTLHKFITHNFGRIIIYYLYIFVRILFVFLLINIVCNHFSQIYYMFMIYLLIKLYYNEKSAIKEIPTTFDFNFFIIFYIVRLPGFPAEDKYTQFSKYTVPIPGYKPIELQQDKLIFQVICIRLATGTKLCV